MSNFGDEPVRVEPHIPSGMVILATKDDLAKAWRYMRRRLVVGYDPGTPDADFTTFTAFFGHRMIGSWRSLPWWLWLLLRCRLAVLVMERN